MNVIQPSRSPESAALYLREAAANLDRAIEAGISDPDFHAGAHFVNAVLLDIVADEESRHGPCRAQAAEIARAVNDLMYIDGLPIPQADRLATAIEELGAIAAELADGGVSHD